ncbi:poly-gamma-glutamate hydrolase family protein [Streptomyces sp. H39-C1]|uniref:poly-gamma-glutamate hydrolase family protein n=1 Tax=Streptomyces sp. H39-C1 TaxID=3004355 RepID=UPI0022B06DFE|nr:poly-gamma-glutamate hydrolase family protein [Streptomyces sp. H39-C1]MCZ4098268.1 poly-gamma-glutamate hydrolase family protein [Streptomyces sp. H39-C1]
MTTGLYNSFAALASAQIEGIDYQRSWRSSPISTLLHLAIHGGGIEQGTSELASAAAGDVHDFYTFDGTKQANNSDLHLASTSFDDPQALALAKGATHIVSWHGAAGAAPMTNLGGLDYSLRDHIGQSLSQAGFAVQVASEEINGNDATNICNRSGRGMGVQLEISSAQRQAFFLNGDMSRANRQNVTEAFTAYVKAVTSAITTALVAAGNGQPVPMPQSVQEPIDSVASGA